MRGGAPYAVGIRREDEGHPDESALVFKASSCKTQCETAVAAGFGQQGRRALKGRQIHIDNQDLSVCVSAEEKATVCFIPCHPTRGIVGRYVDLAYQLSGFPVSEQDSSVAQAKQ